MHRAITAMLILVTSTAVAGDKSTPKPAARLIAVVHSAAAANDLKSLRRLMALDFVSSFGGEGGKKEALALWGSDPIYLRHLAKATASPCQLQSPNYVECPRRAGIGYRAGFKLINGKWVFASFVAGD